MQVTVETRTLGELESLHHRMDGALLLAVDRLRAGDAASASALAELLDNFRTSALVQFDAIARELVSGVADE